MLDAHGQFTCASCWSFPANCSFILAIAFLNCLGFRDLFRLGDHNARTRSAYTLARRPYSSKHGRHLVSRPDGERNRINARRATWWPRTFVLLMSFTKALDKKYCVKSGV